MKANERGSDPKLKEAMEEIKSVLKKYDCLGAVVLISPTHSEYLNHIESSWSVMRIEDKDGQHALRFRSKLEDFESKEAQTKATAASAHALTTIIEWSRKTNEQYRHIVAELAKHMKIAWETWE